MEQSVKDVFFALIRSEINEDALKGELKNLITTETLPALFKVAKKHDLAHLVGEALEKNGLLADGSEAKTRFLKERNMAIFRYEQIIAQTILYKIQISIHNIQKNILI